MPPPRKVDLLPPHILEWLHGEFKARGFGDYEGIAERLNARLAAEGCTLSIRKSALHDYGAEFRAYALMERQSQAQIRAFMEEASLRDEADVTTALFQQLTAIQFRLQMAMAVEGERPDPRGMKDLTVALNNLIRSSSLRAAIVTAEHREQAARLDAAVGAGDIDAEAAARARRIMGFA
jgi:hypothetical protein